LTTRSKFSGLLDAAKGRDEKPATSSKKRHGKARVSTDEKRGPGRPPGKRSDPDFTQTTAYIRADTYKGVRIALLEEGEGREYSEIVEELLSKWLKSRK
jgi:hypothetical protein